MKSYDSGGPMVSGHTTPQGGGCDKPVPSEVPPASQPGDPMENWLMGPSLEWLEQAEHGADQQRCKMIADLLRDLWRGPSSGTTSAVMETGTTAVLATQDGLTPLGQRIAALEAYEIILNQIAEVVGIETPYGALPDAVKDLAQRAEADADQARDAARYRWLRNPTRPVAIYIDGKLPFAVDSAIDAELDGPHG